MVLSRLHGVIFMDNEKVKIELINGCEGKSVYINDYRVAGPKPWGGGYTEKIWMANKKDILHALGIKNVNIDRGDNK